MIYLDNNATTKPYDEVLDTIIASLRNDWYNPSSNNTESKKVKDKICTARAMIAKTINANHEEIYFTSGGSEADSWAIKCIDNVKAIITTNIEHSAVYKSAEYMKNKGIIVKILNVDKLGFISLKQLENELIECRSCLNDGEKVLVSIMYANNEIGTINDIKGISEIVHSFDDTYLHTDAVQAYGQINIDVKSLNVDLLSASGHKIGAPKGIGFLYIKDGVKIHPLINGGKQENGLRGGTENVPYILGMAKASEMINTSFSSIKELLRNYLIMRLLEIDGSVVNGSRTSSLYNNISISFKDINGESLAYTLQNKGYIVSNGSACNAGVSSSRVLDAIGLPDEYKFGTIRIGLEFPNINKYSSTDQYLDASKAIFKQYDEFVNILKECVGLLREIQ